MTKARDIANVLVTINNIDLAPQGCSNTESTGNISIGHNANSSAVFVDTIATHNGNRILVTGTSTMNFRVDQDSDGTFYHQIKVGTSNWTNVTEESATAGDGGDAVVSNRTKSFSKSFSISSGSNINIQFRVKTDSKSKVSAQNNSIALSAVSYQED